ncbi:hypothetical protein ElyMa_004073700 [Elysia marginata]|uniref:Secreted protein n=1 Tax=Elysia marginata TaxID=1093978 RepID=A0AAV4G8G3_9GAST|nr:hypothetical protein ElyMa_004073700 [Elysia marginata]
MKMWRCMVSLVFLQRRSALRRCCLATLMHNENHGETGRCEIVRACYGRSWSKVLRRVLSRQSADIVLLFKVFRASWTSVENFDGSSIFQFLDVTVRFVFEGFWVFRSTLSK